MIACCIGTALLHLMAARVTIRGLLDDGLLPGGATLSSWMTKKLPQSCVRWELFPIWLLMQASFLPATLNETWTYSTSITYAILAISVLFITAALNASLLALLAIKPPSFRPEFKLFSKSTATAGVVVPLVVMFCIDHVYSLVFIGIFLLLLIAFNITAPPSTFGEISTAILYHQVRKFLYTLSQKKETDNKFWRPSLLFFDLGLRGWCSCFADTSSFLYSVHDRMCNP
jgi:potassium/chloride transporter 9